jgi:UDP-glucose 4-epimerase
MRILLTGASGVVGKAVLARLKKEGHEVKVLARSQKGVDVIFCDLALISEETKRKLKAFAPDLVIHAAWAGTENTERNDPRFMEINTNAGMQLMEAALAAGCKRWIGFGSQAEYAAGIDHPISENDATTPETNYGKAKVELCAQQQQFARTNGIEFTWLRLFTCYGEGMKESYIIPTLIRQMAAGEMPMLSTPHSVWDHLHADDAADAILRVISDNAGGIYNLGYGEGISIREVAMIIAKELGFAKFAELEANMKANDAPAIMRVANMEKFSTTFSWKPAITPQQGLAEYVARHRS